MIKRITDLILSISLLALVLPLIICIMALLFLQLKGNPFFLQTRVGKKGKEFQLIKFKTMADVKAPNGKHLPDVERITGIGRVLRTTSLDELPQLINVISGSMSIVGPRPLLVKYLEYYTTEQNRRHEVKPGITGWAQVSGRNSLSWEQKFELDVWYVDNMSLWLDVKILILTILKVIKQDGVNQDDQTTMKPFEGTPK